MPAKRTTREMIQKAMRSQDAPPTKEEAHALKLLKGLKASGDVNQDHNGLWYRTAKGANDFGWPVEVLTVLLADQTTRRRMNENDPHL